MTSTVYLAPYFCLMMMMRTVYPIPPAPPSPISRKSIYRIAAATPTYTTNYLMETGLCNTGPEIKL